MGKPAVKEEMSFTTLAFIIIVALALGGAAKEGAFKGFGKTKESANDKITYRYDCNFNDFRGGVEMQTWEGSGTKRSSATTDPFGPLSDTAGEQPKGIGLHVQARALTPTAPLSRGDKPHLDCSIIRVNETTGHESVLKGPAQTSSRTGWLYVTARAK